MSVTLDTAILKYLAIEQARTSGIYGTVKQVFDLMDVAKLSVIECLFLALMFCLRRG